MGGSGTDEPEGGSTSSHPRTSPRPPAGWRPTSRPGLSGQVVKVQGGVVQILQGWRPLTEATADEHLDDRDDRRPAATLFATSDPGVPPFLFSGSRARARAPRLGSQPKKPSGPSTSRSSRSTRRRDPGAHDFAATTRRGHGADPPVAAREWQATLFDHGWMIPAYPPEFGGRNATPIQTLVYLEEMAHLGIPRSLHFPAYGIAAPSLLEFGDERRARSRRPCDPGRRDLVHRDERARRGLRPRRAADRAPCSTAIGSSSTVRRCGRATRRCPSCACASSAPIPTRRSTGDQRAHRRLDTPGMEVRPLRQITGRRSSPRCTSPMSSSRREPRRRAARGWKISQGRSPTSGPGSGSSRWSGPSGPPTPGSLARRLGCDGDPMVRRRMADDVRAAASLRALGYKGVRELRGTGPPPSTRT